LAETVLENSQKKRNIKMECISEFRILFLLRKISGFLFTFCVCCFLINRGLNRNESELIIISLIILTISALMLKNRLWKIYKIKVVENGILKIPVFKNKEQLILFTDIKEVRSEKVDGSSSDAGEITLGYFESILILNTNEKILISPDYFENYRDIMRTIKLNRNNENN
jgi:hypothetical protein